ncbi:MAG: hypothetical protein ACP5E4_00605 [Candidatus Aenigmatarchaeota archaeon]
MIRKVSISQGVAPSIPWHSVPSSERPTNPNDYIRQFCGIQGINPQEYEDLFEQRGLAKYLAEQYMENQNGHRLNPSIVSRMIEKIEKYRSYGNPEITSVEIDPHEGKVYFGGNVDKLVFGGEVPLYEPNGYKNSCI